MSPKVVVYVREDDSRAIKAVEQKEIDEWVRELVKYGVEKWREQHAAKIKSGGG